MVPVSCSRLLTIVNGLYNSLSTIPGMQEGKPSAESAHSVVGKCIEQDAQEGTVRTLLKSEIGVLEPEASDKL
jgi:hypothetical protein